MTRRMTSTTAANTNASTTPILDGMVAALATTLPAELRWQVEGWAAHLRPARHQNHAASSWAKHRAEFGRVEREAHALVVARCLDFGRGCDEAVELIRERVAARAAKAEAA